VVGWAEGFGECLAEPLVLGLEFADASRGELDTAQQGSVGGALAVGDELGDGTCSVAQPCDLGVQVGLAVVPGAGDAGFAATASTVIGVPVLSMRRSVATARRQVRPGSVGVPRR
jgi:hypothetical protein